MDIAEWLFRDILISRHFTTQIFYIFMFVFTIVSVYIAYKARLLRFSIYLWISVAIIGLAWEVVLFASGSRHYSFTAAAELLYHAITEGGPGLMIMAIFADKVGIVDLSEYKEEVKPRT